MDSPRRPAQRACLFCRKRKLRCDRQPPRCQSCTRLGQECSFAGLNPVQHRPRTERNHVQELEERLLRVESLLRAKRAASVANARSPTDLSESGHEDGGVSNGTPAPLDPGVIRDLEKTYFERFYPIMPFINYERYSFRQIQEEGCWPPLYLRYSIWAVAALCPNQHAHRSSEFYEKARLLAEASAVADPKSNESNLCRAQAWLHLAMYDMFSGRFSLVWTSTALAVRFLQIAKVHELDAIKVTSDSSTSKNFSWSEAEEKRRTFWFAFCMDRSAFLGQGQPSSIDEKDVRVYLPALEKASESFTGLPTVTIAQATGLGSVPKLSPLSATCVIYSLCYSNLKDFLQLDVTSIHNLFATSDWVKKDPLCKKLTTVFSVPSYLVFTKENTQASLFHLNVSVHCATIRVNLQAQELARASFSPVAVAFIEESTIECLKAAASISELAKLEAQSTIPIHHPGTAYCIYSALTVFGNRFSQKQDPTLRLPMAYLLNFMRSLCGHSQVACTLFRDLESEYPLIINELSPKDCEILMNVNKEPNLWLTQSYVSTQDGFATGMTSRSPPQGVMNRRPPQDDTDDWTSCATEPIPYDLPDTMTWDTTIMDISYEEIFGSGFQPAPPKPPNSQLR